jgi:hypothetical protein
MESNDLLDVVVQPVEVGLLTVPAGGGEVGSTAGGEVEHAPAPQLVLPPPQPLHHCQQHHCQQEHYEGEERANQVLLRGFRSHAQIYH